MSRAREMLDFNLYLGPDDIWREIKAPCKDESECSMQPWCRIDGRCHKTLPPFHVSNGDKP